MDTPTSEWKIIQTIPPFYQNVCSEEGYVFDGVAVYSNPWPTKEYFAYLKITQVYWNLAYTHFLTQSSFRAQPLPPDTQRNSEPPSPLWVKAREVATAILLFPLSISGCFWESTDQDGERGCIPGQSVECSCSSGARGAQVCQADHTFGTCECGKGQEEGENDQGVEDIQNKCQSISCGPGYACREGECVADCASGEMICGETPSGIPAVLECSTKDGKAEWVVINQCRDDYGCVLSVENVPFCAECDPAYWTPDVREKPDATRFLRNENCMFPGYGWSAPSYVGQCTNSCIFRGCGPATVWQWHDFNCCDVDCKENQTPVCFEAEYCMDGAPGAACCAAN